MDRYLSFFKQQPLLTGALLVILVLFVLNEWRHYMRLPRLDPHQLISLVNRFGAVVLDARASTQFAKGHILGAINVPLESLGKSLKKLNQYKQKPIILVGATSQANTQISQQLNKQGFLQVYALAGGMEAWLSEGLPVTS